MGIIIGKFRKKKSTSDILEKLDQEITFIEEFGRSTEQARKKIIGRFVILAILVYIILAFALYLYYHKFSSYQRLICIIPLLAFPLIIWFMKRFLTWYYSRKIIKNEKKLVGLKDEKKKILDNVMETETYKVAKKILDKFGNEPVKKPVISSSESTPVTNKNSMLVPSTLRSSQTGLRQRSLPQHSILRDRLSVGKPTPFHERQQVSVGLPSNTSVMTTPFRTAPNFLLVPRMGQMPDTPLPLPRNILPRERSVLDKMVDYLVGDGPSNRYALICKVCSSHNGMALKEEFEYLSFRCCYCFTFNPARKLRPVGPTVESNVSVPKALPPSEPPYDSSDVDSTNSETESVTSPIITEITSDSPDLRRNSDFARLSDLHIKSTDFEKSHPKQVELKVSIESNDIPMDVCESNKENASDTQISSEITNTESEIKL